MRNKTCCFSGHRNIPAKEYIQIKRLLKTSVAELAEKGVIYFGCGGARGFDLLAAECVLDLKAVYPEIRLILVCPSKDHTRLWNEADTTLFTAIKGLSDKCVYIAEAYNSSCIMQRNRHLVDNSAYCISYMSEINSGTGFTVEYAARRGLNIINLASML